MKVDLKIDDMIYKIGMITIVTVGIYLVFSKLTGIHVGQFIFPCPFHALTGYYCPGCGGTRAVYALFHLHPVISFLCHPMVLYTAVVGGWFLLSQTIWRVSGRKLQIQMHFRDIYLWLALALTLMNFIAKNLLLSVWGIDLLRL